MLAKNCRIKPFITSFASSKKKLQSKKLSMTMFLIVALEVVKSDDYQSITSKKSGNVNNFFLRNNTFVVNSDN